MDVNGGKRSDHGPLDAVILRGGEVVRETWSGRTHVVSYSGMNGAPVKHTSFVVVLITNLRLIAIREPLWLSSGYDLFIEMDLESISGVSLRDVVIDIMVIVNYRVQSGTSELVLLGLVDQSKTDKENPPNPFKPTEELPLVAFKESLERAVKKRVEEVDGERNRSKIVFDFSALRDQMANGGIAVSSVKCPNCGANLELPEEGDSVMCEYCGSRVQAVDLFKKLKELLAG